ncbi:hypothetical protein [Roseicella sp. DB1501]|uniref:hypothetical protein n=1 Tax=Roseicella sp. DB1501 TaxID=2730925 RepID=UPI001491A6AF|nr:hypothetical protein [Roseicella sp. DB1501]NOG73760.1 hypothetical protein [Roseicella sp. DB1501]
MTYLDRKRVVHCIECGDPMLCIYDPKIRNTCQGCGGASLALETAEARAEIRREYLARVREARGHE